MHVLSPWYKHDTCMSCACLQLGVAISLRMRYLYIHRLCILSCALYVYICTCIIFDLISIYTCVFDQCMYMHDIDIASRARYFYKSRQARRVQEGCRVYIYMLGCYIIIHIYVYAMLCRANV